MRTIYNIAEFSTDKLKKFSIDASIEVYFNRIKSTEDYLYCIYILLNNGYILLRIRKKNTIKFKNKRFYRENEFVLSSSEEKESFNNLKDTFNFIEKKYSMKFNNKIFTEIKAVELLQEMSE